jgi:hypothetical protein
MTTGNAGIELAYYILSAEGNNTIGGNTCSQAGAKPAFFFCHQFKSIIIKNLFYGVQI